MSIRASDYDDLTVEAPGVEPYGWFDSQSQDVIQARKRALREGRLTVESKVAAEVRAAAAAAADAQKAERDATLAREAAERADLLAAQAAERAAALAAETPAAPIAARPVEGLEPETLPRADEVALEDPK